jgi:mRNA-degrading endonuclease RelE of RelBE toxin-antitoxin system
MRFRIEVSPEAERVLAALVPHRARAVRERLLQRLEEVAHLAALRRHGDAVELLTLRVGSYEVRYTLDPHARVVTVCELLRLPSIRVAGVA